MKPTAKLNQYGTYDVFKPDGSRIGTGTIDYVKGLGADVSTQVPTFASTPVVISSDDLSGKFYSNSSMLDTKLPAGQYRTPSGAIVDSNGNIVSQPSGTGTQEKPKTPLEQSYADKNAADGNKVGSGNPIFDAIEGERLKRETEADAAAKEQKQAQMTLLNTSLAAVDSTYQATLQNIENTYEASLAVQKRINQRNIARTKAYGLSTGNALSTPIEFTNAVSNRETEAAAEISKLDNQRIAAIAAARAARDSGNAKLLQSNLDAVQKIENEMRTRIANIATEATNRFNLLNKINEEQETKRKEAAAAMLAQVVLGATDEFEKEKDPTKQDAIIRRLINESGGLLEYSEVLTSLQGAVKKKADAVIAAEDRAAKQKADAADLVYKQAQTNKVNADTAKTYQELANVRAGKNADGTPKKENVYAEINTVLEPGKTFPDGTPVLAPDGKLTTEAFNRLQRAARSDGISRSDFLEEYGQYLQPGADNSYSQYSLTQAEKDKLLNVNKGINTNI